MTTLVSDTWITQIPRVALRPGPWQPRREFDQEAIAELAESLKIRGILTPLRVVPDLEGDGYLIVSGERRWRASALAGIVELPCIVLDANTSEVALRGMAILDNLHRANLRPGEEARAVTALDRLGMTLREIAGGLGKSDVWVSQRLAIAKLPDAAIVLLDAGAITVEEARALTKLLDYPDLIDSCLKPDGDRLKSRLGGHVPESVGERVQAIRRVLEMERQREVWAAKLHTTGQRLLKEQPREGDRRYIRLIPGSDLSRAHQEAGLSCEVWAWEHGRPTRYCDRPSTLQQLLPEARLADRAEQARQAEVQRVLEREGARDAVISAWLATSRGVEIWELSILARERIDILTGSEDRLLARLGGWLGATGGRVARIAAAERELSTAGDRRLIQLWFLLEVAQAASYSVIPPWLEPWLERLGFDDPYRQPSEPVGMGPAPEAADGQSKKDTL